MNVNPAVLAIIQRMPKVELHLHLEGAFTLESLLSLIHKYHGNQTIQNIADLRRHFTFTDFAHFIELWRWKNQFYRQAADFEELTFSTIASLAQQNIVYAEMFFSPWDFADNGLTCADITPAVIAGKRRAERQFGIKIALIADLVRNHGAATAGQRLDEITPFREEVTGIGLGGSEPEFPPELFEPAFATARERGFHVVAHAGEAAGADSIWKALNRLKAERIGHGVRAQEDPLLVEYLKLQQVPLEVCVTSNLRTRVFSDLAVHPIRRYFDQRLLVTINSDDPTMFSANLTDEFILLHRELHFSLAEMRQLTENAIRASFADANFKTRLLRQQHNFWKKIKEQNL